LNVWAVGRQAFYLPKLRIPVISLSSIDYGSIELSFKSAFDWDDLLTLTAAV